MKIFTFEREIDIDLIQFSLGDILNHLENENFFYDSPAFNLHKKVSENHLVFITPRNKARPSEIYEFEYLPDERKIKIRGKYKNKFFPCLLIYVMPLQGLYLYFIEENPTQDQFKNLIWVFLGVTLYCSVIIFSGLSESENIERELKIRLNYLLRQGYL